MVSIRERTLYTLSNKQNGGLTGIRLVLSSPVIRPQNHVIITNNMVGYFATISDELKMCFASSDEYSCLS